MSVDLTEAIDAAMRGFCADLVPPITPDGLSGIQRHVIHEQALSFVTAAAPLIEAAIRAQVAAEVALYADATWDLIDSPNGARLAFEMVDSIIRGES